MGGQIKVLHIDVSNSFYKIERYQLGNFFGPIDLGLFFAGRYNSLNIGTGLLAGSIFPGSNRLFVNGFSPCWGNFYVSSMGGAGLIFDNLGIDMLTLRKKSALPSILYLNRVHGEDIQVEIHPVDLSTSWGYERKGFYGLMDFVFKRFVEKYPNEPQILATGPASISTDFGAIGSAPIVKGTITQIDTWAGRGGFGSKMLQEHGICAIIYGGTHIDEDFRDRKVADTWFENKYNKKLLAKDMESTTKYRFEPKFETGGTFGVNYATMGGKIMAFNYKSIHFNEAERLEIQNKFIISHYLKQFNDETIKTKQQKNCGEPCVAVCKKYSGDYKKDYEPYQTMGPLCGIFDQRAAEKVNHHADRLGFDKH
jgi:glyceraldehyde-3-phosphate dehydrogenase (ferredoxin)